MKLSMSNLQDSFEGFKEQLEGPRVTVAPGGECLMDELSHAIKVLPLSRMFVILRFSFQKEGSNDCAVFAPIWKVCWKNLCFILGAVQPRYELNLVEL